MKITIYNIKGSTGKTPIATNIAMDSDYAIATNEKYHILNKIFPNNKVLSVSAKEQFPKLPPELNVVFDLGGFIEMASKNITSAITQSDLVIIPVNNEYKALDNTLHTIREVYRINKNILIVATKLKHKGSLNDWTDSKDFLNIKNTVHNEIGVEFPIFPLQFSKVFETIFEEKKSISQICEVGGLNKYRYKNVNKQFNKIYNYLKENYDYC